MTTLEIPANHDSPTVDDSRFAPIGQGGFVYFVRSGERGPIKIGRSYRPFERLNVLQATSAEGLEMLLMVEGGLALERELHERFAGGRLHGEWFAPRYAGPPLG